MSGERELPVGWVEAALGETAQMCLGKMLDKAKHTTGRKLPYLRNTNVRWGSFDLSDLSEMYFEESELERYGLAQNDVIVCEGGEPGRCAIWRDVPTTLKFQKALHRVRPHDGLIPEWIVLSLKHDAESGKLAEYFTGTTIKHLTGSSLSTYRLSVPPLNEQRRIVAKIEALQERSRAAEEALKAVPSLLEKFRQSVLAAAFRGDLTRKWREAHPNVEPASVLLERIRNERAAAAPKTGRGKRQADFEPIDTAGLPDLPEGWCWARLGEILSRLQTGPFGSTLHQSDYVVGGIPLINPQHLVDDGFLPSESVTVGVETAERLANFMIHDGDIVLGRRGEMGRCAVAKREQSGWLLGTGSIGLRFHLGISSHFVAWTLRSPSVVSALEGEAVGSTMTNLNQKILLSLPLALPPEAEQIQIVETLLRSLSKISDFAKRMDENFDHIATLNQSILSKAFRGELVPQDPTDEPASVLLERIRNERAQSGDKPRGRRTKQIVESNSTSSVGADLRVRPQSGPGKGAHAGAPLQTKTKIADETNTNTAIEPTPSTPFLDLTAAEQIDLIHTILFGKGALPREEAITTIAQTLRDQTRAKYKRLRKDGALWTAIDTAITAAHKQHRIDKPKRGHVRAVIADAKDYTDARWRIVVENALGDMKFENEDQAIRHAAEWAKKNCGLEFERLRRNGAVWKAIHDAVYK